MSGPGGPAGAWSDEAELRALRAAYDHVFLIGHDPATGFYAARRGAIGQMHAAGTPEGLRDLIRADPAVAPGHLLKGPAPGPGGRPGAVARGGRIRWRE